VYEKVFSFT
jgi:hypothetical protein